jgi:hypothetical protein
MLKKKERKRKSNFGQHKGAFFFSSEPLKTSLEIKRTKEFFTRKWEQGFGKVLKLAKPFFFGGEDVFMAYFGFLNLFSEELYEVIYRNGESYDRVTPDQIGLINKPQFPADVVQTYYFFFYFFFFLFVCFK